MSEKACITVLVPLYNAANFIEELIACLSKIDLKNYVAKLVMIDDCSSDRTLDIVKTNIDKLDRVFAEVHLYRQTENVGVVANHKALLTFVETEYFCFIDCDDIFAPDKIQMQVSIMDENPNYAFCGTDHITFRGSSLDVHFPPLTKKLCRHLDLNKYLKKMPPCQNSSLLYRTSMFRLFDCVNRMTFDISNQLATLSQVGVQMCIIEAPLSGYRLGTGYSRGLAANLSIFLKVLEDITFPIICMKSNLPKLVILLRYIRFILPYLKILWNEHGSLGLLRGLFVIIGTVRALAFDRLLLPTIPMKQLDTLELRKGLIKIGKI